MDAAEFKQIIMIASDAIITVDERHRIIMFNDGAEMMFGYVRNEAIGESLNRLVPERFHKVHDAHIDRFATEPQTTRKMGERELIYGRRKSGEEFPAVGSIVRSGGANGPRFTVILKDITVLTQMRRHLEAEVARLKASNDALSSKQVQREAAEELLQRLMRESHTLNR